MSEEHRDCAKVESLLWRYIDRELSAKDLALVSRALKSCERCQGVFEERARQAQACRSALGESPFGDGFVVRLRRRFVRENLEQLYADPRGVGLRGAGLRGGGLRTAGAPERAGRGFHPSPLQRRMRLLTVAAMLMLIPALVVVGLWMQRGPDRVEEGRLLGVFRRAGEGGMTLTRQVREDGRRRWHESVPAMGEELPLVATSRFDLARGAKIELEVSTEEDAGRPPTRLTLDGPARIEIPIDASAGVFTARLVEGILDAKVRHLNTGESFAIQTPHALASVVGTAFRLAVSAVRTDLEVREGVVAFQSNVLREAAGDPESDAESRLLVSAASGRQSVGVAPDPVAGSSRAAATATEGERPDAAAPQVSSGAAGAVSERAGAKLRADGKPDNTGAAGAQSRLGTSPSVKDPELDRPFTP